MQQVAFSTEYLTAGERVLVKRSSGIHGMADLGGRRVCASKGGTPMLAVQKASPHPIAVGANEAVDCMVMLQQGQVDAVCNDDVLLAGLAAQDPTTQVVGPRFSDEPYGVAMSQKSPDLVRFVNAVLEKIRSDGTWASIYQKWLSPVLGPVPAPPKARYRD
jgi:polar amino acid transport system substrate-binding protein